MGKYESITVKVTAKDIRDGRIGDSSWCPVALAFRRKFKGSRKRISVGAADAYIGNKVFELSEETMNFVRNFDLHRIEARRVCKVKPFTAEMDRVVYK